VHWRRTFTPIGSTREAPEGKGSVNSCSSSFRDIKALSN
jgi:hypothetical protein